MEECSWAEPQSEMPGRDSCTSSATDACGPTGTVAISPEAVPPPPAKRLSSDLPPAPVMKPSPLPASGTQGPGCRSHDEASVVSAAYASREAPMHLSPLPFISSRAIAQFDAKDYGSDYIDLRQGDQVKLLN